MRNRTYAPTGGAHRLLARPDSRPFRVGDGPVKGERSESRRDAAGALDRTSTHPTIHTHQGGRATTSTSTEFCSQTTLLSSNPGL